MQAFSVLSTKMTDFFSHAWVSTGGRMALVGAVSFAFALVGRRLHGVNLSGAIAGGVCCILLFAGVGPAGLICLVALFVMTWASTRLGYKRKLELGLAERREGRNARQILANLAVAAACASAFGIIGRRYFLVLVAASLAEAATDTVASEIGQYAASEARMVTSWKVVPSGTDGGMTVVGSLAGLGGSAVIAVVAMWGGLIDASEVWIPIVAGGLGMLIDSLLGATIQRRGWMSNQSVNFFSTLAAAAIAFVFCTNVN
jgi:uncharacterized protein (TIGR00297 family)